MVYIKCWGLYVEPAYHSWNAWVSRTPWGPSSFRAKAMDDALLHLRNCEECRKLNGLSLEEVEEKLKEIEQDMFLSTPSLGIT